MKTITRSFKTVYTCLLLFTGTTTVTAGEFLFAEARSKPVLIAAHNLDPAAGWPIDKFDGVAVCGGFGSYSNPNSNPQSIFPTSTGNSSGIGCQQVLPHISNPDSLHTLEAYKSVNQLFTDQVTLLWNFNSVKEVVGREAVEPLITAPKKPLTPILTFNIYEYVIACNGKADIHTSEFFSEFNYDYGEFHYTVTQYGFPEAKEIVSGILMLQYLVNKSEITKRKASFTFEVIDRNKGKLPSKTLLLSRDCLHPDLDESKVGNHYPYKFIVTDKTEIAETIISRKAGYAYVISYPLRGFLPPGYDADKITSDDKISRGLMQLIIDAETGETLSFATKPAPRYTSMPNLSITADELEMLVKKGK
jgi:hypothetical protein